MAENTRKVIGIEPASGKGSYVFAPDVPDPWPDKAKTSGIDRIMTPMSNLMREASHRTQMNLISNVAETDRSTFAREIGF